MSTLRLKSPRRFLFLLCFGTGLLFFSQAAAAACGDGVLEEGEDCDDGNSNNNDACRNDCASAAPPVAGPATDTEFCPSQPGDFCTYTQEEWGDACVGSQGIACFLDSEFVSLFPQGLAVGGGFVITFTTADAVRTYLPSLGNAMILRRHAIDPSETVFANILAGELAALRLNVVYSQAGRLPQVSSIPLGELVIHDGAFEGVPVKDLAGIANEVLGGNVLALIPHSAFVGNLVQTLIRANHEFDGCGQGKGFLSVPCVSAATAGSPAGNPGPPLITPVSSSGGMFPD